MSDTTLPVSGILMPKRKAMQFALLILLTLICYVPSLSNGFIWDDDGYVQGNPTLRTTQGLVDIWTVRGATPQYYPLVHSTFWLEYQTWGLWAPGYHCTNLILHLGVSLLWWVLLTRLGLKRIAYLAALVFAIHPIHVETVCWITERKNVLSLLCYLLAAWCYLNFTGLSSRSQTRNARGSILWYLLALLCFVGALLSKTVTCTFPAAMVLVLWVRSCESTDSFKNVLRKLPWKQVLYLLPFFVIGITLAQLTMSMETNEVGASGAAWDQTLPERIVIYGRVVLFYLSKVFVPDEFMFNYPRWDIDGQNLALYVYPLLVLVLAVTLWCLRKRVTLWPLAGLLFSVGTLLPASGLFDVYPMRFSFVADHFAYHATMGLIAIGVGVIVLLSDHCKPVLSKIVIALILVGLSLQTMRYAPAYENWFTLFNDTLTKNPNAWMAHNYLGVAYEKQYDHTADPQLLAVAKHHYREGLKLHQDFAQLHANYGSALIKLGDPINAVTQLKRAVQLQRDLPQGHYWLALALEQSGELDAAITHYQQAVELFPGYVSAWHHMARAFAKRDDVEQASVAYQQAIALRPQSPAAYQELGLMWLEHQQFQRAATQFQTVLAMRPGEPAVLWSLGLSQYMLGDSQQAIALLKEALTKQPADALKLDLAWILVTCPEQPLRDTSLARQLIEPLPDSEKKQAILKIITGDQTVTERRLLQSW
tara:strand:- start:2314 stop:4431 length:2118 start_codon:yes stop_codon:yes gene_type:complete